MSLKYEPASEPLHISVKYLFSDSLLVGGRTGTGSRSRRSWRARGCRRSAASPLPALHHRSRTPHTLHTKPYTLHPTPYTLHPTPYTLHTKPTLHPATPCYTLNPNHSTPNLAAVDASLIGCTSCIVKSFGSRSSFISSPLWTP